MSIKFPYSQGAIVLEFQTVEEAEEFESAAKSVGMTASEYVMWLFQHRHELAEFNAPSS